MSLEITPSPRFVSSVFGKKSRPAEDIDEFGHTIHLGRGLTMADFIRRIYKPASVESLKGIFGFLDRDNKERLYDPQRDDPFVFKDWSSLEKFKKSAHHLITVLSDAWVSFGLPLKLDKDRGVKMPDTSLLADALLAVTPSPAQATLLKIYNAHRTDITLIGSNVDIMKKASVVRTVLPGWWAVSYKGRNTENLQHFLPAVNVIIKSMLHLRNTPLFHKLLNETINDQGDPLDTGVGYPLFKGSITKEGIPEAKLEILELFKKIGTCNYDWSKVRETVASRVKDPVLSRYPFAIASIRRNQPGGSKYAHIWKPSHIGLTLQHDEKGHTSNRVAFMAPYILNLYLSPLQSEWKTLRKMIPGLIFDGNIRKNTFASFKKNNPFVVESDYSNYDRTIPNNLMKSFFAGYCAGIPHPEYHFNLLQQTHSNLSLIWPDWVPEARGSGWIFNTSELGLLSGLKITSEIGTFCNLIVIIQSLLDSKHFNQDSAFKYLISQSTGGFTDPLFLIASDDTLLVHKDLSTLRPIVNAFIKNADLAGLKGSLEIGDRFLMRHMTKGRDTPLIARIWQNTLSNEEPYDDPLKFIVGLCARTDGLLGVKTVDPFNTGRNNGFSKIEKDIYIAFLNDLYAHLSSAQIPVSTAIDFVKLLIDSTNRSISRGELCYLKDSDIDTINSIRKRVVQLLAQQELKKMEVNVAGFNLSTWLNTLHKNAYSPTSSVLLDEITNLSEGVRKEFDALLAKEHEFYLHAMKTIGIDTILK